jgi:hypothetical protein
MPRPKSLSSIDESVPQSSEGLHFRGLKVEYVEFAPAFRSKARTETKSVDVASAKQSTRHAAKSLHSPILETLPKLLMIDLQQDDAKLVACALEQLSQQFWNSGCTSMSVEKLGGLETVLNASAAFPGSESAQFALRCAVGSLLNRMGTELFADKKRLGGRLIFEFEGINWILAIMEKLKHSQQVQTIGCQILAHRLDCGEESRRVLNDAGAAAFVLDAKRRHPQDTNLTTAAGAFMSEWNHLP